MLPTPHHSSLDFNGLLASPASLFSGVSTGGGQKGEINANWAELQGLQSLLVALEFFCHQPPHHRNWGHHNQL